jgi:4-aminobutyrate aminotransferase-like enzyme
MKDKFILLSLDGPYSNVMKIKPPLSFDKANAERVVSVLDETLTQMEHSGIF